MAYNWRIQRAAVEQEILFLSEEDFNNHVSTLERKKLEFEIVSKETNADGSFTVVMRKQYNYNPFFYRGK